MKRIIAITIYSLLAALMPAQPYTLTLTGNATISGTNTGDQVIPPSGGGTADVNEDRIYAVAVTLMRPAKLKWRLGDFGAFAPTERIYVRIANLVRLGSDTGNYMSSLFASSDPRSPNSSMPVMVGETITAHNSAAVLCYVTETDVLAAETNATRTWNRMYAHLIRTAVHSHHQTNASPAGGTYNPSAPSDIASGSYGAVVWLSEAQAYEADIQCVVGGTTYFVLSRAPKGYAATGVHQWMGVGSMLFPVAAAMDGQSFSWNFRSYAAPSSPYSGLMNARVVLLPDWWNSPAP